jgi:hypothetical protein
LQERNLCRNGGEKRTVSAFESFQKRKCSRKGFEIKAFRAIKVLQVWELCRKGVDRAFIAVKVS